MVDELSGSQAAKQRARLILDTLAGAVSVEEVCEALGLSPARFHQMRQEALQGLLETLEPKPAGRPRVEKAEERTREQEEEIRELKRELWASHIREEIAAVMPHVLTDKKKREIRERLLGAWKGMPNGSGISPLSKPKTGQGKDA